MYTVPKTDRYYIKLRIRVPYLPGRMVKLSFLTRSSSLVKEGGGTLSSIDVVTIPRGYFLHGLELIDGKIS